MDARIHIVLTPGPATLEPLPVRPEQGAECVFRGTTRREVHPEYGELDALEYEVYEPMARALLQELAEQILLEFDPISLRIAHAQGSIPVGQTSVLIEVRTAHRDTAFTACRAAIDRLKERIPIFKIEHWANGTTRPDGVTPTPR